MMTRAVSGQQMTVRERFFREFVRDETPGSLLLYGFVAGQLFGAVLGILVSR